MAIFIKKLIPQSLKANYRLQRLKLDIFNDYLYDYRRFLKLSASTGLLTRENIQAYLIKEYHAIEKGLALRHPRPGFGAVRISNLIKVLNEYVAKFGKDSVSDVTVGTLIEYKNYDAVNNKTTNPVINEIDQVLASYGSSTGSLLGGTKMVYKADIIAANNFDFSRFMESRFSTRDFTDEIVDSNLILEAIKTASYTPSVCNRQAWKVFLIDYSNKELRDKFLSVQNGNKGFGEHLSSLLVVTGKLSSFFSYERNQVFIDGGMFAMSLVLALHAKGLGTCCLNTSYTAEKNEAFNKVTTLDEDCVPIMFIGVGHLKESYKVPVSSRKALEELVVIKRAD